MSSFRKKVLQDDELVSFLRQINLIEFSEKLYNSKVIAKGMKDTFVSLDHARLDSGLRVRYLLKHVCERIEVDVTAFHRFLKVLAGFGGSAERESRRLSKELCESEKEAGEGHASDEACSSKAVHEICLGDIPFLMESLATISDKWQEIGIALGLPSHILSDCRGCSNAVSLAHVLSEWIKGSHHPEEINLKTLKVTLESQMVGRSGVAQVMVEKFKETKRPFMPVIPATDIAGLDSALNVIYQTTDIKVDDGKSMLLEVQVNPNESVSYQWMKDGQSLSDDSTYSGVCSDILAISSASLCSEGEYTCHISRGSEEDISELAVLTVNFLPEKKRLINLYSKRKEIPQESSSWPPVGTSTFVNLALIKKNTQNTDDNDYTVQGDADNILAKKEKAEFKEMFGTYESGKLLLVEGRPGSGKTTLVHKVTRDWATRGNVLKNAKLVFHIPLRTLAEGKDESLSDILEPFYRSKGQREKVSSDIDESDGEGVCFIIDGLDEYQPEDGSNSVIYQMLRKTYLSEAMIIVASRPVATATLRHEAPVTQRIEVLGFTQQQIFEYIDKFPFSAGISNLRAYLDSHRNVLHMCYLPIHAAMVCFLYQHEKGNIPSTETEMYENFTRFIVLRKLKLSNKKAQLHSLEDLPGEVKEYFRKLCHLAFDMTIQSKQVVHQCDTEVPLDDAPSLGLVTIDSTAALYGFDDMYTFLHLTFQEYLAAFHLAKLEDEEQMKIVGLYTGAEHMWMVWKFYSGMVKFEGNGSQLKQIMSSVDCLHRVQCAFESQQSIVCDHAISEETGVLDFSDSTLTPADLTAVGYVISSTSHTITEVGMSGCNLHADHVRVFLREVSSNKLKHIQTLELSRNNIGDVGAAALAQGLKSCINLQELRLVNNNIGDDGAATLAQGLKFCNSLQTLHLAINNIGVDGAIALAEGLKSFNNLHNLELSHNSIGDDGAEVLAEGLKSCNGLQILGLSHNSIGDEGAAALAEGLKSCSSLDTLLLSDNSIGDDGAAALAEGLKSCNCLDTLDLSYNSIGDDGVAALAEVLKSCNSLDTLLLSDNSIGDDGAAALAEGLKSCNSLDTLLLSDNSIGDDGAAALAEGLKSCNSLDNLDLSYNSIGDDGAAALADGLKSCNSLHILDLQYNDIGDEGAAALAEGLKSCANLVAVDLSDNNIGDDCAAALEDINCFIHT